MPDGRGSTALWYPFDSPLVLASRSPRRHEILCLAGIPHIVRPADVEEENGAGADPEELVARHAGMKADAVSQEHPGSPVLGADTVVWLEGTVLGKPSCEEEAAEMLSALSGRTHTVFGGVCLVRESPRFRSEFVEATRVTFRELTPGEIRAYVSTGEPMDKAGAYGIQGYGSALVRRVEGCYFNVMGLPVARVAEELKAAAAGARRCL